MEIDGRLVSAIAHCRLGSWHAAFKDGRIPRPEDSDFRRAEQLGFLRHHPTWHATEAGEGVLVAVGLLDGKPAVELSTVHVLWAQNDMAGFRPNFVAAFSDGLVDCWAETYAEWRMRAEQEFADFCDEGLRFFTTVERLPVPAGTPEHAWEVTR